MSTEDKDKDNDNGNDNGNGNGNDNGNDNGKAPAGDDDGWGEAADSAETTPEPEQEAPAPADTWDSTKLEERVAALAQERELPASEVVQTEPPDGDTEQDAVSAPVEISPTYVEVSVPVASDAREPSIGSVSQVVEVVDEDAPQWSSDELELPAPSSDMAAAAGVLAAKAEDPKAEKRRKRRERHPKTKLTRRQQMFLMLGSAALVIVLIFSILGYFNNQNYYLVCRTKNISAEQGSFWPWGQGNLAGPAFRPIGVPSDVLCSDTHYDSKQELELAFLAVLLEQSTTLLITGDGENVQSAEQQLGQALLLTRDPARSKQREQAERLQGDVLYWRGADEVRNSIKALKAGAALFEEAAAKRPRHNSDANAWAEFANQTQEQLSLWPRPPEEAPATGEPAGPHFSGLSQKAHTIAPDAGVGVSPPERAVDAGLVSPDAEPFVAPPEPDAGLPKGGVLL